MSSNNVSLVCFAFGVARIGPGQELAGPALMRLLGDLGLSHSASRSLLLRMRHQGLLGSTRAGREARYRLAPVLDAGQARLSRQLSGRRPAWTGSFTGILYEVPERRRDFRDRLRRAAVLLGYVPLRAGLVVATTDRWEQLVESTAPWPRDARVLRTRLSFSDADSRRIATELWNLDAVAARYRAVIDDARARCAPAASASPPRGRAAFQAFAAAALPLYEAAADDPDLPEALLPDDWPAAELTVVMNEAVHAFWPLLESHVRGAVSGAASGRSA